MVKDSVLITGGINLGASPSAEAEGNVITVTFGGKVIEPILVFGTDLQNNCRGFLVPYGAEVTIKVTNSYNLNVFYFGGDNPIIQYEAGKTYKFLAVTEIYIKSVTISEYSSEIAPTEINAAITE